MQTRRDNFTTKVQELRSIVLGHGFNFVPFCWIRPTIEQGRLWSQSRSIQKIIATIHDLEEKGAPYLATCLRTHVYDMQPWRTNQLPALSWHQHGLAVDCYYEKNGEPCWDSNEKAYEVYAGVAKDLGLVAGYYWRQKDAVHVQAQEGSPLEYYTWPQLNDMFNSLSR